MSTHNNPYQDPTGGQTTESMPSMEDLQPRSAAHAHVPSTSEEEISAVDVEGLETHDEEHTAIFAIGKLNDFLLWFIIVLEITLLLRFFFMLIGAAIDNPFVMFLYSLTGIFLAPFNGIVSSTSLGRQGHTFEWSTLIGMLVYWLIFYAIRWFLRILISRPEVPE